MSDCSCVFERRLKEVNVVQGHKYSISPGNIHQLLLSFMCIRKAGDYPECLLNPHLEESQWRVSIITHHFYTLQSRFWPAALSCSLSGRPNLAICVPWSTLSSGVGGWVGKCVSVGGGDLGPLKLSSGATATLPAHPSWPGSPQIDSPALLIRSLVTVGGWVCVCVWTGRCISWGCSCVSFKFQLYGCSLWLLILSIF